MAGFRNVREYVDACEGGQNWITGFRKTIAGSGAGMFCDLSNGAGTFPPNYFASAPLVGALMPENKGIFVPDTGTRKYIKDFTCMLAAATATSTFADGVDIWLADYLMYYPFIDQTTTDLQEFENPVSLPRYTDGKGIKLLWVFQQPTSGVSGANITINYTNQDGNPSSVVFNFRAAIWQSNQMQGGTYGPNGGVYGDGFVPLALGDTGIRSVQSVQLSADIGGLGALVLVKPLLANWTTNMQGCRRSSATGDSFGSASQSTNMIHRVDGAYIEDGAYLCPIYRAIGSTAAGAILVGTLETVWN